MITTLWIIGLVLFFLALIFGTIADGCRLYRTTRLCENWSLAFILTAVTLFGTAMYLTSQEGKLDGIQKVSMVLSPPRC